LQTSAVAGGNFCPRRCVSRRCRCSSALSCSLKLRFAVRRRKTARRAAAMSINSATVDFTVGANGFGRIQRLMTHGKQRNGG
jgi:hypothetical protein